LIDNPPERYPPWERLVKNLTLHPKRCFLLDNGQRMIIWVGQEVDGEFLHQAFGVTSLRSSEARHLSLVDHSTVVGDRIKSIIAQFKADHPPYKSLLIIKQGGEKDNAFIHLMVEDRVEETMSHADVLAYIHREVSRRLGKDL